MLNGVAGCARRLAGLLGVAAVMAVGSSAGAQCTRHWEPGDGVPGLNNRTYALAMWDPDGAGPRGPLVVAGGDFTVAGDAVVNRIATLDDTGWHALGAGFDGGVFALLPLHDGSLLAGGAFTTTGTVTVRFLGKWNGTTWTALTSGGNGGTGLGGIGGYVEALTELPNGDVLVGGRFATAGGVTVNNIARWNGTAWSALGTGVGGFTAPRVTAIAVMPNGDIIAVGRFETAGDQPAQNIARWDGTAWNPVGGGLNAWAQSAVVMSNGDLAVGGTFITAGGISAHGLARWDGSTWSDIGGGSLDVSAFRHPLVALPNNGLLMGGSFLTPTGTIAGVGRWDGVEWSGFGLGTGTISTVYSILPMPTGKMFVCGELGFAGGVGVRSIASWDGQRWAATATGFNSTVRALATAPSGDLVAGGDFISTPSGAANRIARKNASGTWTPLGSGINGTVRAVATTPDVFTYAAGDFTSTGDGPAVRVARFDGAVWAPLGDGFNDSVNALAVMPNGDLIAGGRFTQSGAVSVLRVARWDGGTWLPMGGGIAGTVLALVVAPNGDLIAGGQFAQAGGQFAFHVARWNGTAWSAMGTTTTLGEPNAFAIAPNGTMFAGQIGGVVSRWTGTAWTPLGATLGGDVNAVLAMANGDVVAGGNFGLGTGATGPRCVARWNGTAWTAEGTGTDQLVYALAHLAPEGDYAVGGQFTIAGGIAAGSLAYNRVTATTNPPVIVQQPQDPTRCHLPPTFTLSVGATSPTGSALAYAWRKDGTPLVDVTNQVNGSQTSVLQLGLTDRSDSGLYDVVVSDAGGCTTSRQATVWICRADFNCSGALEVQDVFDFLNAWLSGDMTADYDGVFGLQIIDILQFVNAWFVGCG